MRCIVCRLCQSWNEALLRRFDQDLCEQTNYRGIWEKEKNQERLRHAQTLEESNPAEAYREYREMAEGGSVWAMERLGWAYQTGTGTSRDLPVAIFWYDRALSAGSEWALFALGHAHLSTGDFKEAERVYTIGIARNLPQAMTGMAKVYMKRSAGGHDWEKARALLEQAIVLGDLEAKRYLARLLIRGRFGLRAIPSGFRLARNLYDDVATLLEESDLGASDGAPKEAEPPLAVRLSTA